jgi:hypothetical protein
MDATAGATATKVLDALKSMPTWLLVGLSISLLSMWLWPPFLTSLPDSLRAAMPVALFVASTLTICNVLSLCIAQVAERRRQSRIRDREHLLNLYRPLDSLFLTRHITVSTATASPRLRHRLENAWEELGSHGRRARRVKRAWRALFDKQR